MSQPAILSIAPHVPPHRHTQTEMHDRWLAPHLNSRRARAIFEAAEIEARYSALANTDFLADNPGTLARNKRYMQTARPLAAQAGRVALAKAGLTPKDIDHLIVISCTGLETPGLDVQLAADLELGANVRRSALIGMGCHAGLTGLDRAWLEGVARPHSHTMLLAAEFGTLHFQPGGSLEQIIAGAIFGDGLAAVIIGPARGHAPRIIESATYSDYSRQAMMGFHLSDHGFKIHLSTKVARVLGGLVSDLIGTFLEEAGLTRDDIRFWGIHPGGAKIVDYTGDALSLPDEALRFARDVLRRYGNMSSATIFFVLDEIIRSGQPQPGDHALLMAFGPGLTVELCLLKW